MTGLPTTHPLLLAVDGAVGAERAVLDEAELVDDPAAAPAGVEHLADATPPPTWQPVSMSA